MDINTVHLSGRVTSDAATRALPTGLEVLEFGLAFNERVKSRQTGEYEDRPNFVDCRAFGGKAAWLARKISRGSHLFLCGHLRWDSWEKDGQRRSKLIVVVDSADLGYGSGKPENGPQNRSDGPAGASAGRPREVVQAPPALQSQVNDMFSSAAVYDDEIPF